MLIKILYSNSDRIIAISSGVQEDLVKNFKIPEKKIMVIYNPIDIEEIQNYSKQKVDHKWLDNSRYKTIITVGRLEIQKNQAMLIRAFKQVYQKLPETRLIILGEGNQRRNLIKLIKDLEIESRVQLLGQQNNPFKFVTMADLFVLSSDYEGFGNVIIEAMACGCPVVSTNCKSGPNEIITNEENGILVTVNNVGMLSEAIISLLQNSGQREKLVYNAYKRITEFRVEKISRQYYHALLE
jgi:glycosyltransferase involved in cell wall biosynthesis